MTQPSIGERLRRARESVPASLYEAARETKIRVDFLQAMERDSFRFSWSAYSKGMMRAYARWLGLNEEELVAEFERIHGEVRGPSIKQLFKEPAQAPPRRRGSRWMIAAALAASTFLILSLVGVMNPTDRVDVAPPPPAPTAPRQVAQAAQTPIDAPLAIQGVQLIVTVVGERCWMSVRADGAGTTLFEGTLFREDVRTFQASDRLEVLFGNMAAVSIQVNGRDLGIPEGPGSTGTFVFHSDTTTFVRKNA